MVNSNGLFGAIVEEQMCLFFKFAKFGLGVGQRASDRTGHLSPAAMHHPCRAAAVRELRMRVPRRLYRIVCRHGAILDLAEKKKKSYETEGVSTYFFND